MYFNTAPFNAVVSQLDSAFSLMGAVTDNALDGAIKIFELQLSAARATLADASAGSRQFLDSPTIGGPAAAEWLANSAGYGQSAVAKTFAYGNEMASILGTMQGKLAILAENGTIQSHQKMLALLGDQARQFGQTALKSA